MMKRTVSAIIIAFASLIGVATLGFSSVASAMPIASNSNRYVALGDSVAAGYGLPSTSTNPVDQLCGRSTEAYPYLVAATLHNTSLTQLACSSASVAAGLTGPQQVSSIVTLPSQVNQAFANGTPKVITITIGANDVGWNNVIEKCYVSQCGSTQDNQAIQALLSQLKTNLNTALSDIQQLSSHTKPPRVVVTGYYFPLSATAPTCNDTEGLTPTKIDWLSSKRHELDGTIRAATSHYRLVKYASLNFKGHELCTADSWVQGLQSAGPFHPTTAGQKAIAKSIVAALSKKR
jgi:lysophospholipase L1-like esterase